MRKHNAELRETYVFEVRPGVLLQGADVGAEEGVRRRADGRARILKGRMKNPSKSWSKRV